MSGEETALAEDGIASVATCTKDEEVPVDESDHPQPEQVEAKEGEETERRAESEEEETHPETKITVIEQDADERTSPAIIDTERDFDKNPTVLFSLLQKKEWKAAIERAHMSPEEAGVWVSRKEKDGRLRWRLLPIHAAIVFKAPEDVIETLIAANDMGVKTKDDQGMLPLHLAFRNGSTEGVVKLLLVAYPESIDIMDRKGRVPLVLAQSSSSPFREAYLTLLEGGPGYFNEAAAAQERAVITANVAAEQRALFDKKMALVKEEHRHEIDVLTLESKSKQCELAAKVEELETELAKNQETSQILVDHLNALETQLNSRADTEKFLTSKIATLDESLQTNEMGHSKLESELRFQNVTLIAERDGLQSKFNELEQKYAEAQSKLTESVDLFERREQEWSKNEADLQQQVKSAQFDWANAQANCAILDAQLKKKMETEHSLATQVSVLAGKLAEQTGDSRSLSAKYAKKIKDLEEERVILRGSVRDLTKRLRLVASVLDDMTVEQQKIVNESKHYETAISDALSAHAKIVADAMQQQHVLEEARREREQMKLLLAKQEEDSEKTEARRENIMNAIVIQGQHMEKTQSARADMLTSVANMGNEVKYVLENVLSVLPDADVKKDDEVVDAVIKKVTCEDTPMSTHDPPAVDAVPSSLEKAPTAADDDNTASTENASDAGDPLAEGPVVLPNDRIMEARGTDV